MYTFQNKAEAGLFFHLDNKTLEVQKDKTIILNEEDYNSLMKKYGCFINQRLNKFFFIEKIKKEANTETEIDEELDIEQLKEIAKSQNIKFASNISKKTLIKKLKEYGNNND